MGMSDNPFSLYSSHIWHQALSILRSSRKRVIVAVYLFWRVYVIQTCCCILGRLFRRIPVPPQLNLKELSVFDVIVGCWRVDAIQARITLTHETHKPPGLRKARKLELGRDSETLYSVLQGRRLAVQPTQHWNWWRISDSNRCVKLMLAKHPRSTTAPIPHWKSCYVQLYEIGRGGGSRSHDPLLKRQLL